MAGIAGLFTHKNEEEACSIVTKMSQLLIHRGEERVLAFDLHQKGRVVASVRSLQDDNISVKKDGEKLQIAVESDCKSKELAMGCLEIEAVKEKITIRRYPLSMIPLYYGRSGSELAFASERKALWSLGISNPLNLQPGSMLSVGEKSEWHVTPFAKFERPNILSKDARESSVKELSKALKHSFMRVKDRKVGVLFSGGVDSSLVAFMAKQLCKDVRLYSASSVTFHDRNAAKTSADALGMEITTVDIDPDLIWEVLPHLLFTLETADLMDVEIALPFYLASRVAASEGINLMISGQGPDELFAGYARHVKTFKEEGEKALEEQLWKEVSETHEANIERDDRAISIHGIRSFFPYLSPRFISLAMSIPGGWKVSPGATPERKVLFRELAQYLGLPKAISFSPKKATQYSSGSSRILMKSLTDNIEEMKDVTRRRSRAKAQSVLNRIGADIGIPLQKNTDGEA